MVAAGFSSPTSSVESFKVLIALAGTYDLALVSSDVSTAYMTSPLPPKCPAIIRLPAGTTNNHGSPTYMILDHALHGLRPAALAWVLHFRSIWESMCSLKHCE